MADVYGKVGGGGRGATAATIANAGEVPQAVYRTRLYGKTVGYDLKVPDGKYAVRLHFAEPFAATTGVNRFDVAIEGQPALANFDVFAEAGGRNRAAARTFGGVEVRGGLQVAGAAAAGVAQFSGIEVSSLRVVAEPAAVSVPEGSGAATFGVRLSDPPAGAVTVTVARVAGDADVAVAAGAELVFDASNYAAAQPVTLAAGWDDDAANGTATIRCRAPGYLSGLVAATEQDPNQKVNCGGPATPDGWTADAGWSLPAGGGASSTTAATANTGEVASAIYRTRRYGRTVTYNLSIPDGTYSVRLHFAELAWTTAGRRKFNVAIEGQPKLTAFDIFAAAGGKNRAVVRTFDNVEVRGGLQIQGAATVDTAQFNGIEVWPAPKIPVPKRLVPEKSSTLRANGRFVAGSPQPTGGDDSAVEFWPRAWARSGDSVWALAPSLVDGDTNTVWRVDCAASSWSVALDFDECVQLEDVEILYQDEPWHDMEAMGTGDLMEWYDLRQIQDWPVPCRALYLFFPRYGSDLAPAIREIRWREDAAF